MNEVSARNHKDAHGPAMIKEKMATGEERMILPNAAKGGVLSARGVPFLSGALNCPEVNVRVNDWFHGGAPANILR